MTVNLSHIKIVLVNTSHPGNIGAAARAMKTMGLSQLVLVAPRFFPDARATEMASNADDVLANAQVVSTLEEAIASCGLIIGASARLRTLPWPMQTAREAGVAAVAYSALGDVALVFGREDAGLTNEELSLCHYHMHIPSNPVYPVLNLAQAVQVACYEVRQAAEIPTVSHFHEELATPEELARFYTHLQSTLTTLKVHNPLAPKQLLQRVRRLFQRVQLEKQEVNLLRGILTAIDQRTHE